MVSAAARAYLVVLAIALAASVSSIRNGFVYDDEPAVRNDDRVHTLGHLPALFAVPYWNNDIRDRIYRPATTVSFALDWAAGSGSPVAFHTTNVALHLIVCALVFALARRVLGAGGGALVAALWFAVQPVHVEAIANIVGRSELLAAAGYVGAVLAYAGEADTVASAPRGMRRAALALAALVGAAIAYGGKEHALTLPAALLLTDAWTSWRRGVRLRDTFVPHAITWAGVTVVAVGYLAARHAALGTTFGGGSIGAGLEDLNVAGRTMVMTPALLVWARLLLLPARLSADYSPNHFAPVATLTLVHVVAGLLLVGVCATLLSYRHKAPGALFGLGWLVITASIAANVVFPTGVMVAERVLYLPSVGAALILGALWERRSWRWRWPATAVLLTLLAARSIARIPVWHDGERFYQALIHDAPNSYRSHWASGARAFEQHRLRESEDAYLTAITIYSGDGAVLQELGEHYLSAGLYGPADRFLTVAWRVDSTRADAVIQAVAARLKLGRADSAAQLGLAGLRVFPTAPALLLGTSDALFAQGKPLLALTYRRRMVYAFPRTWQYQYVVAEGAARAGRCDEARMRADRAMILAPAELAPKQLRARLGEGATCRVPA